MGAWVGVLALTDEALAQDFDGLEDLLAGLFEDDLAQQLAEKFDPCAQGGIVLGFEGGTFGHGLVTVVWATCRKSGPGILAEAVLAGNPWPLSSHHLFTKVAHYSWNAVQAARLYLHPQKF
jgi:hypothetical protein